MLDNKRPSIHGEVKKLLERIYCQNLRLRKRDLAIDHLMFTDSLVAEVRNGGRPAWVRASGSCIIFFVLMQPWTKFFFRHELSINHPGLALLSRRYCARPLVDFVKARGERLTAFRKHA